MTDERDDATMEWPNNVLCIATTLTVGLEYYIYRLNRIESTILYELVRAPTRCGS